MQVTLHIFRELLVKLILLEHEVVLAGFFLCRLDQLSVVISIEETWHFTGCKQGVHALEESSTKHVRLIKNEDGLALFNACLPHDLT